MKRIVIWVLVVIVLVVVAVGAYVGHMMSRSGDDPAFFSSEIEAFLEQDREHPPAPGQIVFVGSSSIRFWTTLADDMAPLSIIRRGFGGSHLVHVIHEAPRIIVPYAPRAVVVYAGDNDIGAGRRAEDVAADFEKLVALLRASLPEVDVWFISIKPSRLRFKLWPEIQRANERIRALGEADPRIHFIDIGPSLLDADGRPRKALFRWDGLHLNAAGYAAWTSVVKPRLLEAYGGEPVPTTRPDGLR